MLRTLTDCVVPPEITATSADGCTNTCMLADADFCDTVFVTVTASVYILEVFNEYGGNRNFDASRDCEEIVGGSVLVAFDESERRHEYWKNLVEVDPSQFAVKAFVATKSCCDLV